MIGTKHQTALLQTKSHTAVVLKTLQLSNLLPSYPENLNNMQNLVAYSPVIWFPSSPEMAISKNSMRAHTPSHVSTTRSSLLCSKLSNCSSSPRKNAKTDSEYPKRTPPKTVQLPADCKQSKWCSASPRSSILFPNYLQKLKGEKKWRNPTAKRNCPRTHVWTFISAATADDDDEYIPQSIFTTVQDCTSVVLAWWWSRLSATNCNTPRKTL